MVGSYEDGVRARFFALFKGFRMSKPITMFISHKQMSSSTYFFDKNCFCTQKLKFSTHKEGKIK